MFFLYKFKNNEKIDIAKGYYCQRASFCPTLNPCNERYECCYNYQIRDLLDKREGVCTKAGKIFCCSGITVGSGLGLYNTPFNDCISVCFGVPDIVPPVITWLTVCPFVMWCIRSIHHESDYIDVNNHSENDQNCLSLTLQRRSASGRFGMMI